MGVSRLLAETDIDVPARWQAFLEPLQMSSDLFYTKLSANNREVEEDLKRIERKIGTRRLYDEEEVRELRDKIEDIQIDV